MRTGDSTCVTSPALRVARGRCRWEGGGGGALITALGKATVWKSSSRIMSSVPWKCERGNTDTDGSLTTVTRVLVKLQRDRNLVHQSLSEARNGRVLHSIKDIVIKSGKDMNIERQQIVWSTYLNG